MNKKFILILTAALMASMLGGCGGEDKKTEEMPENIISYKEKDGKDLVPVAETEVVGEEAVVDPNAMELPGEDELGEYEEIFMEGDIINETTVGGWVVAVSQKDITVNTYNELTTYVYEENARNTGIRLKPGDAVVVSFREGEDGVMYANNIGRVRTEDEPLTRDEIESMYKQANGDEGGAAVDAAAETEDGNGREE